MMKKSFFICSTIILFFTSLNTVCANSFIETNFLRQQTKIKASAKSREIKQVIFKLNLLNLLYKSPAFSLELEVANKQSVSINAFTGKSLASDFLPYYGIAVSYRSYYSLTWAKFTDLEKWYLEGGAQLIYATKLGISQGIRLKFGHQFQSANNRFVFDMGIGPYIPVLSSRQTISIMANISTGIEL